VDKIKVGYIGDSPFAFSGFGVVARAILSRLPTDTFEIYALGTMYQHYPSRKQMTEIPALEYYAPVCIHDMMGFKTAITFLQHTRPDVLFLIADPGTVRNRLSGLMLTGSLGPMPTVTYFPLEGYPLNPHVLDQARMVYAPVTYTKWGMNLMKEYGIDVDYVLHGVDHAPFDQYDSSVRDKLRRVAGWDNKFVIGMVGVNKRTNRQPAMIEMARILKDRGRRDFIVYLHCQERGDAFMGGWELQWLIDEYDVGDVVWLKPNQAEHKFVARPRTGTLDRALDLPLPSNTKEAKENLAQLDFISLLNCFDIYMDPASAHGFNLPLAESMRCGVPGITVDDGFARSEIYDGAVRFMKPTHSDYWHTGAMLPMVSPARMADTACELWDDSETRMSIATAGKSKVDSMKWQPVADLFSEKLISAFKFRQGVATDL